MNGTTSLALVDLSPYGFASKEFVIYTLLLCIFWVVELFLVLGYFDKHNFAHSQKSFRATGFPGVHSLRTYEGR